MREWLSKKHSEGQKQVPGPRKPSSGCSWLSDLGHLSRAGGGTGARAEQQPCGWAHEPPPTAMNMAPGKVGLAGPGTSLPEPPGPAWPHREQTARATHRAERAVAEAPAETPEKSSRGCGERARRPPGSSSRRRRRGLGSRRPWGSRVRPAGPGPWDAQPRQVLLPRRPASRTLSCDQERPRLSGLVPQRRGHLALPQDPTARRAAGGATPPNSRLASPAAARLGSAPPTRPARSPGQPRLQRDAWRPTRGASAARSWRWHCHGHLCAMPPTLPHAAVSAAGDSPEAPSWPAVKAHPCPEPLSRQGCQPGSPESSRKDFPQPSFSKIFFYCRFQIPICPFPFFCNLRNLAKF